VKSILCFVPVEAHRDGSQVVLLLGIPEAMLLGEAPVTLQGGVVHLEVYLRVHIVEQLARVDHRELELPGFANIARFFHSHRHLHQGRFLMLCLAKGGTQRAGKMPNMH
jgi:hypothetical protein